MLIVSTTKKLITTEWSQMKADSRRISNEGQPAGSPPCPNSVIRMFVRTLLIYEPQHTLFACHTNKEGVRRVITKVL